MRYVYIRLFVFATGENVRSEERATNHNGVSVANLVVRMFQREFVTSIHVADPISFCINTEANILAELASQFEGRNHKGVRVVRVEKIIERSACVVNVSGLDAAATINVKFLASVDVISANDIIYPVEIFRKDPMILGVCRIFRDHESKDVADTKYMIYVTCIDTPEMATVKMKQSIPLLVDRSIHEYRSKFIACSGKFLTHNNNNLTQYRIKPQKNDGDIFNNNTIVMLIAKIEKIRSGLKLFPAEIVEFFEKLYEPTAINKSDFDLLKDKKLPEKYHELVWSRDSVRRTSGSVRFVDSGKGPHDAQDRVSANSSAKLETLEVVIMCYVYDIYNYNRLIYSLVKTCDTKSLIKENMSIWKIIRPGISGGFETAAVDDAPKMESTSEDGTRFSKAIIQASEKYGSKFKWDTIRITKDSPKFSLMPWHLNSHNKALADIVAGREIKVMIDLTTHVGIDSINLASEFPKAKLIGVELDSDICKIYKCNLAMITNPYEAICGNAIDVISTLEVNLPGSSLIYLDPPWGGSDYKNKDTASLELTDLKGRMYNMIDIVKLIFNKQVSDLIIIKTPTNFDMQDRLLQEPTWKCTKYEIKNETNPGQFFRASYLLFAVEAKEFIPPSFKEGKQFQYILSNDELRSRLEQLLKKFEIDVKTISASETDIEIYQKLCSKIRESRSESFGKSRGIKRFRDIRKYIPDSVQSYMDIGAGDCDITADIAHELKLKKENTYCIDYTGKPSQRAEKHVTFSLVSVGSKLPIADKSVDLITAFQSMHHFQDIQFKLEEITRITSPSSTFVIREHDIGNQSVLRPLVDVEHLLYMICFENMTWNQAIEEYYAYYRTKEEWSKMLEKLGWKLTDITAPTGPTNYYYAAYQC